MFRNTIGAAKWVVNSLLAGSGALSVARNRGFFSITTESMLIAVVMHQQSGVIFAVKLRQMSTVFVLVLSRTVGLRPCPAVWGHRRLRVQGDLDSDPDSSVACGPGKWT